MSKNSSDYKEESREKFNKQTEKFDSGYGGKHSRELYDNVHEKLCFSAPNALRLRAPKIRSIFI